jgi:hypothetical protein
MPKPRSARPARLRFDLNEMRLSAANQQVIPAYPDLKRPSHECAPDEFSLRTFRETHISESLSDFASDKHLPDHKFDSRIHVGKPHS